MFLAVMIVGGFVALIAGGELLVRGASLLALAAKVSPLVIGLTVVAFGTSAPELGVSIQSCYAGAGELAIGNAVGSNIANLLFVLGATALAAPLAVHSRLFKLDIPVMIAAAIALWALGADGSLSRLEGLGLTGALVAYFAWTLLAGRREQKLLEAELEDLTDSQPPSGFGLALAAGQVVAGLVLLVGGANFLVSGCVELATLVGVSKVVIGLTVTAIGTSLPELVTSFMAARRGKRDLAVGNVVGSNILNVLAVLGVSALVAPGSIPVPSEALTFHIPIMVAVSAISLPIFFTGGAVARWEGASMLVFFFAYVCFAAFFPPADPSGDYPIATTLLFAAPLAVLAAATLLAPHRRAT